MAKFYYFVKKSNSKISPLPSISANDIGWYQWFSLPSASSYKLNDLIAISPQWRGVDQCGPMVWALRQSPYPYRHLKALIQAGLDVNEADAHVSPIFEACYRREKKCIELLLMQGANLNSSTQAVPLAEACRQVSKSSQLVLTLIKHGASIAPSRHFNGLIKELDKVIDDNLWSNKNRNFWDRLVGLLIENSTEWQEFKSQWIDWVENEDIPTKNNPLLAWLTEWEKQSLSIQMPEVSSKNRIHRL